MNGHNIVHVYMSINNEAPQEVGSTKITSDQTADEAIAQLLYAIADVHLEAAKKDGYLT